jgi:hypothetical protein
MRIQKSKYSGYSRKRCCRERVSLLFSWVVRFFARIGSTRSPRGPKFSCVGNDPRHLQPSTDVSSPRHSSNGNTGILPTRASAKARLDCTRALDKDPPPWRPATLFALKHAICAFSDGEKARRFPRPMTVAHSGVLRKFATNLPGSLPLKSWSRPGQRSDGSLPRTKPVRLPFHFCAA